MKDIFFINAEPADRITYYHLAAFAITLPFNRLYSELALISLLIHTLIQLRKNCFTHVKAMDVWVSSSIYILTLIGTAYTHHTAEAFSEWERQAAVFLFPVIVALNRFDFKKYIFNIILALALCCAITILCLYCVAFETIAANGLSWTSIFSNAFLNHNFAAPIDMHATYFSMYIALGSIGIICAFAKTSKRIEKCLYTFVFLVLLAGLIQLSSRAVLISFAVIIAIVLPFFIVQQQNKMPFVFIAVLLTVSVFFALTKIENFKTRFIVELKEDLAQKDVADNLSEPRVVRWRAAKALLLSSPVYGHGSGSEIPLLKEVYYEHKLFNSYLNSLNIHNEYLSMFIKTGAIGLVVWLFVLVAGFKRAIVSRDVLFCSFLVLITTVSFSENIMDGNKGIFFFAFFYSIFYIENKKPGDHSKIKLLQ